MNFEQDTLYLSHGQKEYHMQYMGPLRFGLIEQDILYPDTLGRIQRIALPMPSQPDIDVYQYRNMLKLCTGLTKAMIVCGQGENGLALKQEASMYGCPNGGKRLRFSEPASAQKKSCEEFVEVLKKKLVATNERLPPPITCKLLERI